jgi:O-antigen ligase
MGFFTLASFLAGNAVMALVMRGAPMVATAHAVVTLLVGFWLASSGHSLHRVAYVAAYVVGAEVLWRMSDAATFYEQGKYAVVAIFVVALLRNGRLRPPAAYLGCFALLLPSVMLTLSAETTEEARQQLSFNLSGPLTLFVCAWFFWFVRLTSTERYYLFLALLGPVFGLAIVTLTSTMSRQEIAFGIQSNFATSAGFGPNQVSAMLGLGALIAFLIVMERGLGRGTRLLMIAMTLFLGAQSALTFSRGGLYAAGGAVVLASLYLMRDVRTRVTLVPVVGVLILAVHYFLFPYLNAFTGGALSERFHDTDLTSRDELIRADLDIWRDNPLLGVGPGESRNYRTVYKLVRVQQIARPDPTGRARFTLRGQERAVESHTEFSRLLSEHGLFGLGSLVFLMVCAIRSLRMPRPAHEQAVAIAMIAWSVLFMSSNAMRLAAPSFMFAVPLTTAAAMATVRARRIVGAARSAARPLAAPDEGAAALDRDVEPTRRRRWGVTATR